MSPARSSHPSHPLHPSHLSHLSPPRGVPLPPHRPLAVAVLALVLAAALACAPADTASDTLAAAGDTAAAGATTPATAANAPVAEDAAACNASASVTSAGIGPARLGTSAQELTRLCGARDTSFSLGEGITETGLVLPLGGSSVVALVTGDTVRRLIVREPGLATAGGVGVGSTVADVRRAYPDACALVGEGLIVLASNELQGVSFATSADFSRFAAGGSPDIAALPDTARVATLWVHGVERPCAAGP